MPSGGLSDLKTTPSPVHSNHYLSLQFLLSPSLLGCIHLHGPAFLIFIHRTESLFSLCHRPFSHLVLSIYLMPSKNNRDSHRQSHKQTNIYHQTLLDSSPLAVTPNVDAPNEQRLIPIKLPPLHLDPSFELMEDPQNKNLNEVDTLDLFDPTLQCTPELLDSVFMTKQSRFSPPVARGHLAV
jgi:hypothetical protein